MAALQSCWLLRSLATSLLMRSNILFANQQRYFSENFLISRSRSSSLLVSPMMITSVKWPAGVIANVTHYETELNNISQSLSNNTLYKCDSVLRKRRRKMNRHKYKKLRRKQKFLRRRLKK